MFYGLRFQRISIMWRQQRQTQSKSLWFTGNSDLLAAARMIITEFEGITPHLPPIVVTNTNNRWRWIATNTSASQQRSDRTIWSRDVEIRITDAVTKTQSQRNSIFQVRDAHFQGLKCPDFPRVNDARSNLWNAAGQALVSRSRIGILVIERMIHNSISKHDEFSCCHVLKMKGNPTTQKPEQKYPWMTEFSIDQINYCWHWGRQTHRQIHLLVKIIIWLITQSWTHFDIYTKVTSIQVEPWYKPVIVSRSMFSLNLIVMMILCKYFWKCLQHTIIWFKATT